MARMRDGAELRRGRNISFSDIEWENVCLRSASMGLSCSAYLQMLVLQDLVSNSIPKSIPPEEKPAEKKKDDIPTTRVSPGEAYRRLQAKKANTSGDSENEESGNE